SADAPATPEDDDLDADAIEIEKWNWPTPIRKGDLSQSVQTARTFGTSLWKQCRAMRGEDASFDVFLDSILANRSEAFT
ncbi:hypothetical protein ABFV57_34320, partial [Pseudomonas neuropathica]|uniref:hypothetical protein n=1 Tax=Pseudomonas neuropathica TaxID=2730425 RepID=UPI0034D62FCC